MRMANARLKIIICQQVILESMGLYDGPIDGNENLICASAVAGLQLNPAYAGLRPRPSNTLFQPHEDLPKGWAWDTDAEGDDVITFNEQSVKLPYLLAELGLATAPVVVDPDDEDEELEDTGDTGDGEGEAGEGDGEAGEGDGEAGEGDEDDEDESDSAEAPAKREAVYGVETEGKVIDVTPSTPVEGKKGVDSGVGAAGPTGQDGPTPAKKKKSLHK
jgi:hypothetical protein